MKVNPVYQHQTKISARSFRLPMIIFLCNSLLALVALLDMYSMVSRVKSTAEIQYSSFLSLYIFAASIEFIMLLLIVPALTAGSISGERERQTLNLLLTTRLTPKDIVLGKLFASLSTVCLLVVSSFPVLSLVFIYGGVTGKDILLLCINFLTTAVLLGCVGICCSSVFKRSTISTVVSYCVMAVLVFGTSALARFAVSFGLESGRQQTWPGLFGWLLLLNPSVTFTIAMSSQMGNVRGSVIWTWTGDLPLSVNGHDWLWISVVLQLLLSGLCLWLAVLHVNPRRKKK